MKNAKVTPQHIAIVLIIVLIATLLYQGVSWVVYNGSMLQRGEGDQTVPVKKTETITGGTITLRKNESFTLSGTDITLELTIIDVPPKNCADCMKVAKVTVKQGSNSETIQYLDGGIVGNMPTPQVAFGYTFELKKYYSDNILLEYKKN